jgi:hypothetical protein
MGPVGSINGELPIPKALQKVATEGIGAWT